MTKCFAGLDWASRTHAVCIIDERGTVRSEFEVSHDAAGLAELCRRLKAARVTAVAIERPSGVVVDTLLEADLQVVPIHPNVVKATRPRYRSHGGKSDATDAYLLADLLRTDGHRFKPLAPQSDEIRTLRALVRGRDDLVATRVQLANQLREVLQSFWPGAAEVFADVDSPIALAFIQRYPTPESASRLGPKRMAAFCAQHAYSGRRAAEELLERLKGLRQAADPAWGLSLHGGASVVAGFVQFREVHLYISPEQPKLEGEFVRALGARPAEGEANLVVLSPFYRHSVLFEPRVVEGLRVVSDLQLFLDLSCFAQRGKEQADVILERRLRPAWAAK